MSTVVTVPERSLARGNCLPNMFAALTINIACQQGPQQPDLYHTGGLGVTAALGSRKMSKVAANVVAGFPIDWRVRFGGLLWVANCYESWVHDDVFIWLMLTIDLLLPVLWFDDCEEKGEAQGSKTEILKGVFSFAFPLGFYAASPWQCEIAPLFAIWLGIALPDPNGVPSCMIQLDRRYIMCEGIVVDHYHTIYLCFSIFGPLLTKLRG